MTRAAATIATITPAIADKLIAPILFFMATMLDTTMEYEIEVAQGSLPLSVLLKYNDETQQLIENVTEVHYRADDERMVAVESDIDSHGINVDFHRLKAIHVRYQEAAKPV